MQNNEPRRRDGTRGQAPQYVRRTAPQNVRRAVPKKKSNAPMVFLIVFVALALLIAGFIASDFLFGGKKSSVQYTIGEKSYKLSADIAYSGNTLMICFDDISEICEMTVTGSIKEKCYYAESSDQSITLTDKSAVAILNGKEINMLAPASVNDGKMYAPLEFVSEYMSGIIVEETKNEVTVQRGQYNAATKDTPLYSEVTFPANGDSTLTPPKASDIHVAPTFEFTADLSAYEQYMCPENVDDYLILVNRESTIDASYVPSNLVDIADSRSDRTERMVETAEKALEALYIEMRTAGYTDVSVTSGYRSYEKQEYLYNLYTEQEMANGISREEAQKVVDTYSAKPGTSEHQTGLCCDMHNLPSASQKFAEKDAYVWLTENAYKFGFILRFPEDKEDITGYSFEPWHYRFVGRYHATEMKNLGMCLEEYVAYIGDEK